MSGFDQRLLDAAMLDERGREIERRALELVAAGRDWLTALALATEEVDGRARRPAGGRSADRSGKGLLATRAAASHRLSPGKATPTSRIEAASGAHRAAPAGPDEAVDEAPDRPAVDEAEPVAAPHEPLLVDDDVTTGDRLRRSEFLALLRAAVIDAGQAALGPTWVSAGCPYIERWFAAHAGADAAFLDRMARRFSGAIAPRTAADYLPGIQRRILHGVLRWRDGGDISRDLASAGVAPLADTLRGLGPGTVIDASVAARFGDALGADLSDVRVHTGARAASAAHDRDARAFTVGRDVVFAAGAYRPGSPEGDALLAHELAHVMQQHQGRLGPDAALPEVAPEGGAHEADADQAAVGVLARLYGGVRGAVSRLGPRLRTEPRLQRCKDGDTTQVPPGASLTIGKVAFNASDNRVAPNQTATVTVDIKGLPSGKSVAFDVDGSGGGNGSATITAGASLMASGTVDVKGGAQTAKGSKETLFVRAKVDGTEVGKGPGFTVAAWPVDYTDVFSSDLDDGVKVGVVVKDGWSSDGGGTAAAELTQVELAEVVDVIAGYPNPPFDTAVGNTSKYLTATNFSVDTHSKHRSRILTSGLPHAKYTQTKTQLNIFKDARTGVTDKLIKKSGFHVIHDVWWNDVTSKWNHKCTKVGAAVTIGSNSAAAGGGSKAESPVHVL